MADDNFVYCYKVLEYIIFNINLKFYRTDVVLHYLKLYSEVTLFPLYSHPDNTS